MSIFVFGSNFMTQLGIPEEQALSTSIPIKLDLFEDKKIIKVVCGKLHTIILCETKDSKKDNDNSKKDNDDFKKDNDNSKKVDSHLKNVENKSKNQLLYTWGCNDDCALGREGEEGIPTIVPFNEKIVDAVAGASFSALLTDKGQVFACGTFKSSSGILGFDLENKFQKKFKKLNLKKIIKIGAGHNHIIAVDSNGTTFTFGANESLQLGRINRERSMKYSLVPLAISKKNRKENHQFVEATGGSFHTLALNSDGQVYSWGSNYNGQLGNGTNISSEKKKLVVLEENSDKLPQELSKNILKSSIDQSSSFVDTSSALDHIKQISCGINHSVFLNKDGILYGCGDNTHYQIGNIKENSVEISKKAYKFPVEIFKNVQTVRTGCDSTIALSDNKLYSTGINFAGSLGHSDSCEEISEFTLIDFDFGKIIDFDSGADFTVVYSEK